MLAVGLIIDSVARFPVDSNRVPNEHIQYHITLQAQRRIGSAYSGQYLQCFDGQLAVLWCLNMIEFIFNQADKVLLACCHIRPDDLTV